MTGRVVIHRGRELHGHYAEMNCGRWKIACFSTEYGPRSIWTLDVDRGSAQVSQADDLVIEMAPQVAALYGVDLTEAAVADAIAACRLALAEHAIADLKVAELMKSAEVVS